MYQAAQQARNDEAAAAAAAAAELRTASDERAAAAQRSEDALHAAELELQEAVRCACVYSRVHGTLVLSECAQGLMNVCDHV